MIENLLYFLFIFVKIKFYKRDIDTQYSRGAEIENK